jgi:nitrogen-specific signal transduction histidine kinase/CheY-like chemotaxis protein
VIRDATEARRLQQQQRQADQRLQEARRLQSLGVLAGGLAHDLNNALTAILGNVGLCRDGAPPALQHWLDEIVGNARAAADLCRGLLAGAGAGPLVRQAVDLGDVIAACVDRERALAPPGVAFDVKNAPRPVYAFADRVQLSQVVGNLLRNAVEALAGRGGTVAVRCGDLFVDAALTPVDGVSRRPAGPHVWFDVADDGPGMPADVRARLFEPFFTTKFTGRGIGLASAHGIVNHHGGTIDVDSEPGQGTLFRVVWPAPPMGSAVSDRGDGSAPPAVAPARSVVVVDDDPAVRQVTARLLRSRGCVCHEAGSGDELLAMLRQGLSVDAVVLDAMMPGKTGPQTLADVRLEWPALPVVLVSGHLDLAEFARDGGVDFLPKPFTVDELLARLDALLRPGRTS